MKPYGVPRDSELESPDCGTLLKYGGQSKHGEDIRSNCRRSARRVWKKLARREARNFIRGMMNELSENQ